MNDRYQTIAKLVVKDLKGTLNRAEKKILDNWIAESPENNDLYLRFASNGCYLEELDMFQQGSKGFSDSGMRIVEMETNINAPDIKKGSYFKIPRGYRAIAAALLILIAACIFLPTQHGNVKNAERLKADSTENAKYFLRASRYSNNHDIAVLDFNNDTIIFQSYESNNDPTDLVQYKKDVLDTIAVDIVAHVYREYKPGSSSYTIATNRVFAIETRFNHDVFDYKVSKPQFYHTNDFK